VLPIGGLKEKLLAAHRAGITLAIIPENNERELQEIPAKVRQKLDIRPVKWIDEVIELALESPTKPISGKESGSKTGSAKKKGSSPDDVQPGVTAH
jgi:ATP-dependent Lon protease